MAGKLNWENKNRQDRGWGPGDECADEVYYLVRKSGGALTRREAAVLLAEMERAARKEASDFKRVLQEACSESESAVGFQQLISELISLSPKERLVEVKVPQSTKCASCGNKVRGLKRHFFVRSFKRVICTQCARQLQKTLQEI